MAGIAEQGNSEKIYRQDFNTKHQTMNAITMNPIQNAVPMLGSCWVVGIRKSLGWPM